MLSVSQGKLEGLQIRWTSKVTLGRLVTSILQTSNFTNFSPRKAITSVRRHKSSSTTADWNWPHETTAFMAALDKDGCIVNSIH